MNFAESLMLEELRSIKSHLGITHVVKRGPTVIEGYAEYSVAAPKSRRDSGWQSTQSHFKPILEFFGLRHISELKPVHLKHYLDWRTRQPKKRGTGFVGESAAVQEVRALITMLYWLKEEEMIPHNPLGGIKRAGRKKGKAPKKKRIPWVYTEAEIDLLLATSRLKKMDRLTAVLSVMRWSGVRPGELIKLKWSHYDAARGELRVPAEIAKTDVDRKCAILSDGLAALEELRHPGSPWLIPSTRYPVKRHMCYRTLGKQFVAVARWAGLVRGSEDSGFRDTPPHLYDMRHTLATRLGFVLHWSERRLARWMGWENTGQAAAYVHAQEHHDAEQAREIETFTSGVVRTTGTIAHMSDYVALRKSAKRSMP